MTLPAQNTKNMLQNLDERSPFTEQLKIPSTGPIILINTFIVPEGKVEEALAVWADDASIMKAQKGFISAQMHRGVESNVLVNIAVWADIEGLRNGIFSEEFQQNLGRYPVGTVAYPHVCRRVGVPGICIA